MIKTMNVVVVEPRKKPRVQHIDGSLEGMQAVVGGLIQAIYPYNDDVALICNEEGKILGLEPNRLVFGEDGTIIDVICGTFFIAGVGIEEFCGLTQEQSVKYVKLFDHNTI